MGTSGKSPAYLHRSPQGVWYFRIVVPPDAQSRIGQKVIKRSLRTRSKREAVLKASSLLLEVSAAFGRNLPPSVSGPSPVPSMQPCSAPAAPAPSPCTPPTSHGSVKLLSELFENYRYLQELEGVSLKTLDDKQAVVNLLIKIVGDLPMPKYKVDDALKFREVSLKLPPLATRTLGQNSSVTIDQLIDKSDKKISITTYNNYVKNLVTVFEYALSIDLIYKNPFSGMRIKRKEKSNSYRSAFTEKDLQKIFRNISKQSGWKYWVPYLGYYGAFRLNEVCQLYKEDIKIVDSIPCIHVNQSRPKQKIKNVTSERIVPIHPDLISMGFLGYVDSLPSGGMLFDLRWTEKHGYSSTPSKWFGRLREKVELEQCGSSKKDFHSFRHTIANQLKQKGCSENLIALDVKMARGQ